MANLFQSIAQGFRELANNASRITHEATYDKDNLKDKARLLNDFKNEAWNRAEREAAHEHRPVSWSDFANAADALWDAREGEMKSHGIPSKADWDKAVLIQNGRKLHNAVIRKEELQPSRDVLGEALRQARDAGIDPKSSEYLSQVRTRVRKIADQLQNNPTYKLPSTSQDELEDLYDLDGDHTVSHYYAEVDHHIEFKGTVFNNVTFHPAGTLTKYNTEGASYSHCTFDGMSDAVSLRTEQDYVLLKGGKYEDIKFTNIKGGEIELGDGAQIHGMDIQGARATLTLGNALIDHLNANGARIVTINVKEGKTPTISHSSFDGATIHVPEDGKENSAPGQLQGIRMMDVSFKGSNIDQIDMSGANLTNVNFKGAHVKDVNLTGATLTNVDFTAATVEGLNLTGAKVTNLIIEGRLIKSAADLEGTGIKADGAKFSTTPEFTMKMEVAGLGQTLQNAVQTIGTTSKPAPVLTGPPQQQAADLAAKTNQEAARDAGEGMGTSVAMMRKVQPVEAPALPGRGGPRG